MKKVFAKRPRVVWYLGGALLILGIMATAMYAIHLHKHEQLKYKPGEEKDPGAYFSTYDTLLSLIGSTREDAFAALGYTDQTVELMETGTRFGIPMNEQYGYHSFDIELVFQHQSVPSCMSGFTYKTTFSGTEEAAVIQLLRLQQQLEKDLGAPYSEELDLEDWLSSKDKSERKDLFYYQTQWDIGQLDTSGHVSWNDRAVTGVGDHVRYWMSLNIFEAAAEEYEITIDWRVVRIS